MNLKLPSNQFTKRFSYGEQLHPSRDWIIVLMIALCVVALSAIWNVWIFTESVSGKQIGSNPTSATTATPIPTSNITGVQDVFKARATEEQNYQKNYKFVDPSI